MSGDLSRWMGSVSDISKADEYAKKPPLFKKLFASGSVEEEAMASFMEQEKSRGYESTTEINHYHVSWHGCLG